MQRSLADTDPDIATAIRNEVRRQAEGLELIGHHEILLPLLHAAVACKLAASTPKPCVAQAA